MDQWAGSNDVNLVIPAMVVEMTWAGCGTTVIVYLAALMSVRTELYEAAEIERSKHSPQNLARDITSNAPNIIAHALVTNHGLGQLFTEPYIMTSGGPRNQSLTVMLFIYRYAFADGNYGKATALSVMLAVVLGVLSIVYQLVTRKWSSQ